MKFRLLITFILLSSQVLILNPTARGIEKDSLSILFIGNSHFEYSQILNKVRLLAAASGRFVYADGRIELGWRLTDHSTDNETATKIGSRDWDYVILQGVGPVLAYPDSFPDYRIYEAMEQLQEQILLSNDSCKIMFCMPWAYEDGMTWYQEWTDSYVDMQYKNYQNTISYCEQLGLMIAPVGWAWNTVLRDKNYPLHYLHLTDYSHPNAKGSYLMACVFFSAIYVESTEDLNYLGGLEESEARYFQNIASNMVLQSLSLWNIPRNSVVGIDDARFVPGMMLSQNYPNPFHENTRIDYQIIITDNIQIEIFNRYGQKILTLVDEFQSPGSYTLSLDRGQLPVGIYYYSIKSSKSTLTKKMIIY